MNKIKILVVEDETIVALDIKSALEKLNFEVTNCVTNEKETLLSISKEVPDIILMDIYLENSKDGIQITKEIQKIQNIPVIYLTAYSDEDTINKAIETNPVGYLLKPFKREELKSTILLAFYKINQSNKLNITNNCIDLGFNYYYDIKNQILFYKNIPIKLSLKEKHLLTILVEAKGSLISFIEIEYLIWPDGSVSNSALRTLIYRLRSKLEYKLIETLPSIGCKLTPKF